MIDREKVLKGLECCCQMTENVCRTECPYCDECIENECVGTAHLCANALELLKSEPQWISIKDRLPDAEGNYLAWEKDGFAFVDTFKDGKWVTGSACLAVITHWMSLPEPPKEAKQDET